MAKEVVTVGDSRRTLIFEYKFSEFFLLAIFLQVRLFPFLSEVLLTFSERYQCRG
jgi:hypothetical protein